MVNKVAFLLTQYVEDAYVIWKTICLFSLYLEYPKVDMRLQILDFASLMNSASGRDMPISLYVKGYTSQLIQLSNWEKRCNVILARSDASPFPLFLSETGVISKICLDIK